ncbi:MAG: hypothetical protein EBZ50_03825 [Alphaproteobacteria bacterium]|nr:hypothetical protein [Alphaproteobacteria bacterium]
MDEDDFVRALATLTEVVAGKLTGDYCRRERNDLLEMASTMRTIAADVAFHRDEAERAYLNQPTGL